VYACTGERREKMIPHTQGFNPHLYWCRVCLSRRRENPSLRPKEHKRIVSDYHNRTRYARGHTPVFRQFRVIVHRLNPTELEILVDDRGA